MIAKLSKGRGFRGALEYDLHKEKGEILSTNMAGNTPRALAAEFGEIRKLRPNLGKAVVHVSLSAALGEKLTNEQWQAIGEKYVRGMGFKNSQYVITRHNDTEHQHIHIIANRVTMAGGVVSDGKDYARQETLMREIEREYGLQRVEPSKEAMRKAPTKGEIEAAVRTSQPSTRQQLQQICTAAVKDCKSFTVYQERLEAAGVEVVPVVQLGGAKLSGLSYRLDGVTMKGSDLGRGFTGAGIQKQGISYEQDRDFAAVSRSIERESQRAFGSADRDIEAGQARERGGVGSDAGAIGAGHGHTGRGNEADAGRDRPQEHGAGREIQAADQPSSAGLERSEQGSADRNGRCVPRIAADQHGKLRTGDRNGADYSSARERILALAIPAEGRDTARPASGSRVPETVRDRSLEAIQRQVNALGSDRLEVGVRDAKTGKMMQRTWSRAELEQATPWLKRMNARGNDVFVRPPAPHGLVLVDDLKPQALEKMRSEGFAPAAVIETSPNNYQAWVKLSDRPLSAPERQVAALVMANKYGGDRNSADSHHYGRLAGFTNQKPKHTKEDRQPYVLAHESSGEVAKAAPELLEQIREWVDKESAKKERQGRIAALDSYRQPSYGRRDADEEYQRQAKNLLERYGKEADFSRVDWMIAKDMVKSGRYSAEGIAKAIEKHSPHVESRKAGHVEDYARRTVQKAWDAPEVASSRQVQQQEQKRDRRRDLER